MTRSTLAAAAAIALIALTLATWSLSGHGVPPWQLALLAQLKITVIGWVFLELDKAPKLWFVLYLMLSAGFLAAVAVLVGSPG